MVKVIYVNDEEYDLSTVDLQTLKTWPTVKLLEARINPKYLQTSDMSVVNSKQYAKAVKKYGAYTNDELASIYFGSLKRPLSLVFFILTVIGFLFGYFTYFDLNTLFDKQVYVVFFYILTSMVFYFSSFFIYEIAIANMIKNKLEQSGRLLLPQEVTSPILHKIILTWIILQMFIQLFVYFVITAF